MRVWIQVRIHTHEYNFVYFTALPQNQDGPTIEGVTHNLTFGKFVELNCTTNKSKPAANLTFYIDNSDVSIHFILLKLSRYTTLHLSGL